MTLSRRTLVRTSLAAALPWPLPVAARQASDDFLLGAQTHFDQGWQLPWMDLARRIGTFDLRDNLSWSNIETRRGSYDFGIYRTDFLVKARRDGVRILLVIDPKHPAYDDGQTVFSETGQAAFAEYLNAVLDRFGDVISAVEVGNEINGETGMTGPAASNRAEAHVRLLSAIQKRVKPAHAGIPILGGSTNVIGIGFLENLFAAGGLEVMDGVSVHPYRSHAEHVDMELAALKAAMLRHGRPVPIYAPEFGSEVDDAEDASPLMLKMVAMMGAAGVRQAWWYALSEERWYRNMGLYTQRQALKPAGETFAMIQRHLLPGGRPVRVETDDRSYVYRFGRAGTVVWGVPRPMRIVGPGQVLDARGRAIARPTRLDEAPVVVLGDVEVELGSAEVLADSFHAYGRAPWSYFAAMPDGSLRPLGWVFWEWTTYIGDRGLKPLQIGPEGLLPAGDGASPIQTGLRYTAPVQQSVRYTAVLHRPEDRAGYEIDVTLRRGDATLRKELMSGGGLTIDQTLDLAAGDTVDLLVGHHQTFSGSNVSYRVTLTPWNRA